MKFIYAILFILLNVVIYFPPIIAQPGQQNDKLKNEAILHMKNGRYGEAINLLNNYISANPQQSDGYNLRGLAYEYRGQFEEAVYDLRSARKISPQNSMINENLNRVTKEWYKLIYNNIEGYKREIAIDPSKPINYLQIGKSYKNLGEWEEAEIWYDKYLTMEKASPDEIIRYTEILAKNNHIEKGLPILKKYVNDFPDDQRLWARYGYFLLWLGQTNNAIKAFEQALELKPFFKEAIDGLARAKGNGYIYTFNDTATYKSYKFGAPQSKGYLIDIYFKKLARNPGDDETRIKLINELLKVNRYEEAYQQLQILMSTEGNTEKFRQLQEKVLSERDKYINEKIVEYEKLLKQNPGNREMILKLAGYYSSLGMYNKAVGLYSDYLAFHPDDTIIRYYYIQNAAWDKQYRLAGSELDVLIIQYPDSIKYKLLRARIWVWQNKNLSEAEKLLGDVLQKEPDNFDALLTLAFLNYQKNDLKNAWYYVELAGNIKSDDLEIARLKFEIGKQDELNKNDQNYLILADARKKADEKDCYGAVEQFEKYNEKVKPDKNLLLEEADAYLCIKDYRSALKIYNNLLSQSYNYEIAKKKAKVLLWNNDPLNALNEFIKLSNLDPEDSEVKMYMGDAYFGLKQYDNARKIYDELLSENPGSKLILTRLNWFGESNGNFLAFNIPSYFMIDPEAFYYFDNFDFKYSMQGLTLQAGLNNYITVGLSAERGEIDSLNTKESLYTAKGLINFRINNLFSSGLSVGKTFFENNVNILVGSAFLATTTQYYLIKLDYLSQDAAQIFYSPFLVNNRLKVDLLRLNGEYHPESGLLVSGYYGYYFVSDGNAGSNFLIRIGKKFDELAAGYEFNYLGFNRYSTLYYSPGNFQSHSIWGEWYILNNQKNELKIGGKIGIIPDNNFILRETFISAKFLLAEHFTLQGKISTGSTVRQNLGYRAASFYIAAFWSF